MLRRGGEEFGINRYISLGRLGWLEESGHACGAAAVMPVIEDAGTGDVSPSFSKPNKNHYFWA